MSIGKAVFPLATRPVQKQPSPVLEVEARPKILPIHGGVENLGIHYGVVMDRFASASCMRQHRTDISSRPPFFEANN